MINGNVVTDSESDDPEQYVGINDPFSSNAVKVIAKQRAINKRQMQRFQAKIIAEENFLTRKVSKKASCILKECPDIGTVIEKYVEEHNVGADAWRRTRVLTFDGNSNLKQKVTFQEHLQHVYHKKISFGSVVQLCDVYQPSATLGSQRLQPGVHERALILDIIQIRTGLLPFTKD